MKKPRKNKQSHHPAWGPMAFRQADTPDFADRRFISSAYEVHVTAYQTGISEAGYTTRLTVRRRDGSAPSNREMTQVRDAILGDVEAQELFPSADRGLPVSRDTRDLWCLPIGERFAYGDQGQLPAKEWAPQQRILEMIRDFEILDARPDDQAPEIDMTPESRENQDWSAVRVLLDGLQARNVVAACPGENGWVEVLVLAMYATGYVLSLNTHASRIPTRPGERWMRMGGIHEWLVQDTAEGTVLAKRVVRGKVEIVQGPADRAPAEAQEVTDTPAPEPPAE